MTDAPLRTAIVAELSDHGLCDMLAGMGVVPHPARGAQEAMALSREIIADYCFADVMLPGADAAELLQQMHFGQTGVCPGCVVTCLRAFPVPDSPFPILARPYSTAEIAALLHRLLPENRLQPRTVQIRIAHLLDELSIPDHPGRQLLIRAVGMALFDIRLTGRLSRRIYPALSEQSGVSPAQAERAIRHCIDTAWRKGSAEAQYRIFGSTIDAQRGKPTIAQMIARCADILRLEGFP